MEERNGRLALGLGVALGCSLLVIAFLLGRVTARPVPEAVRVAEAAPDRPVPSQPTVATAPNPEPDAPPLPTRSDEHRPLSSDGWMPPPPTTLESPRVPTPAAIAPASPEQQAIAAYFAQMERLEDVGAGDPQGFAAAMVQSMSSGDFSGFDRLLVKSKEQRDRLRHLTPPRACVDHHLMAVTLSGESVAMMERLKAALLRGDSTALMTIATDGRNLEAQAGELKTLGEAIKRQAGI